MYFWYKIFTYIFYPFAPIYLFFRKLNKKEDPIRYKEKLAKTNDNVIRREIDIYPGDTFDRTKFIDVRTKIMLLNFFENVLPDISPVDEDEVDGEKARKLIGEYFDLKVEISDVSSSTKLKLELCPKKSFLHIKS